MVAIQSQPEAPQPESRWFRFARLKWLVFTLLLAGGVIVLNVWTVGLPLSWTAEYDKGRYRQIHNAIAADPQHFSGKYFDDAIKELGLEDVPWDDSAVQRSEGMERFYHFRGFALDISLETSHTTPPKTYRTVTPNGENLPIIGVLRLRYQPRVVIDGLDRQERMKQFWERIDKEFEMDRRRQQSRK